MKKKVIVLVHDDICIPSKERSQNGFRVSIGINGHNSSNLYQTSFSFAIVYTYDVLKQKWNNVLSIKKCAKFK